jgi:putative effector of murein hydrolase LrgA (UPF0299 family)
MELLLVVLMVGLLDLKWVDEMAAQLADWMVGL